MPRKGVATIRFHLEDFRRASTAPPFRARVQARVPTVPLCKFHSIAGRRSRSRVRDCPIPHSRRKLASR